MFPYYPTENNFRIASEFISKFNRISKFNYQDLKKQISENLSLRTILEAMGLKFIEGD